MIGSGHLDVRRVGGSSLVATFGKANPPLIWRFDLERNHSFTLALQGQDGEWELGVTSLKGEFHPVARFPLREDAEDAFARLGAVLAKPRRSRITTGFKVVAAVLLLFVMTVLAESMLHATPSPVPMAGSASPSVAGVPLPADQVLKAPSQN